MDGATRPKSLKIKNARLVRNKIMKGLVEGPLLVGGLGPGPTAPPPKSGPE